MRKRGISPLIATVLLIGFVVAAAAVAMLWTRGFVGELQEKKGAEAGARLSCATDVQITVTEASASGGEVRVTVENNRERIDGFLLVVHGPAGTDTAESTTGVDAGGINDISASYDQTALASLDKPGGATKVDVIPRLKLGKGVYQPCPDQSITWNFAI